jgi:hypothetical protein
MILVSKTRQEWPAFGFTIEVGRNEIKELPKEGADRIKRRIKDLVTAGLASVEKPEKADGSADVQNPVPGVSGDG